jgi:iron complex transport system substrate-binding protein
VKSLPRVGALLDPDTERVLALRPDLVILYGSQSDLQSQLDRAGIRTVGYRHGGIAATFETLRQLGARTGHQVQARALVSRLEKELAGIRGRVAARPRPRTLLVIGRQPGTLREVYASGGVGFLHEMLEIAGGVNVFGDVPRESVQPSLETILARAPDVILEVRAAAPANPDAERDVWSLIASVPAVRTGRVHLLAGDYLVVPGPRLASATEALGRVLHPDSFK